MSFKYFNLNIDGSGIAIITLNRPETCNSFDEVMILELISIFESLNKLDEIRVILLTAEGKHFSAGADLHWMKRIANFTYEENLADATQLAKLMQTIDTSPKTTIALAHGSTYGGGIGLLACCDIVLADEKAQFCFSEVRIGLMPAIISPYIIRAIGSRQAKRLFLTAETFHVQEALSIGLIHKIIDSEQLFEAGYQIANQILKNGPQALQATKKLLQNIEPNAINSEIIQQTIEAIANIRVSKEAQERLSAFCATR